MPLLIELLLLLPFHPQYHALVEEFLRRANPPRVDLRLWPVVFDPGRALFDFRKIDLHSALLNCVGLTCFSALIKDCRLKSPARFALGDNYQLSLYNPYCMTCEADRSIASYLFRAILASGSNIDFEFFESSCKIKHLRSFPPGLS